METLKGTQLEGVEIDISLAKPQGDKKKKPGLRGRGAPFGGPMRGGRGSYNNYYAPPMGSYRGNRGGGVGYSTYGAPSYGPPAGYDPYSSYGYPSYGAGPGYDAYAPPAYGGDTYYGAYGAGPSPSVSSGSLTPN